LDKRLLRQVYNISYGIASPKFIAFRFFFLHSGSQRRYAAADFYVFARRNNKFSIQLCSLAPKQSYIKHSYEIASPKFISFRFFFLKAGSQGRYAAADFCVFARRNNKFKI